MHYIRLIDKKYPRTMSQIKLEYPDVTLGHNPNAEQLLVVEHARINDVPQLTHDHKKERVKEGTPVESEGEWFQSWEIIDLTTEQLKEIKKQKRNKINKTRDADFKNMTVDYNGHAIDAHEKARHEFNGVVTTIVLSRQAGQPDGTRIWTTADDQDVEFTFDDIINIGILISEKYSAIHKKSRTDKKAL